LKVEQLSSITIGYIATIKGSKDPIIWKSMRILLDSGCAATLINQNLVKTLRTTKEHTTKWTTKAGNFSTHRKCEVHCQPYTNMDRLHGTAMWMNLMPSRLVMT
jgi:hypothetical protein